MRVERFLPHLKGYILPKEVPEMTRLLNVQLILTIFSTRHRQVSFFITNKFIILIKRHYHFFLQTSLVVNSSLNLVLNLIHQQDLSNNKKEQPINELLFIPLLFHFFPKRFNFFHGQSCMLLNFFHW